MRGNATGNDEGMPGRRFWHSLPLALAVTSLVVVAPALLAARALPRGGALATLASMALAVTASLVLASAGAALWKRRAGARDVVFSELMLWGWARRWWAERRLARALELFELARASGARVDVQLLGDLSRKLEARDPYLHGHSRRVARHAVRIARAMGLAPEEVAQVRTAAQIHDVGKLYTPRAILDSPRRLSAGEVAVVELHAEDGARMAGATGDPQIAAIVRHHHERIDGGGYPDGLAGAAIPLGARIIAVADTFDAITSNRAYRRAGSQKRALDVLAAEAGAQLDADAVSAFTRTYSARRPVALTALGASTLERLLDALGASAPRVGSAVASAGASAPALAAVGALALSGGAFRAAHAPARARETVATTASARRDAELQRATSTATAPGHGPVATSGAPTARTVPPRDGHGATPRFEGASAAPSGSATAPQPGSSGSSSSPASGSRGAQTSAQGDARDGGGESGAAGRDGPSDPLAPVVEGSPPVSTPSLSTPTVKTPTISTPTVTTPQVSTPTVTTPTVTTPPVTTPSVGAGSVTVPSVTAPSVTAPSVTVPGVTLPGATVPPIALGG